SSDHVISRVRPPRTTGGSCQKVEDDSRREQAQREHRHSLAHGVPQYFRLSLHEGYRTYTAISLPVNWSEMGSDIQRGIQAGDAGFDRHIRDLSESVQARLRYHTIE